MNSYHYCARFGELYFDGIIESKQYIKTGEDYGETKRLIAKEFDDEDYRKMTILSLTLLYKGGE